MAIYDCAARAAAAARDLADAGIPPDAITRHARDGATPHGSATPAHDVCFWTALLGGGPGSGRDAVVLGRSVDAGSTVLAVRAPADRGPAVAGILERHDPVDMDEQAARHGVALVPARFGARTLPPVIRGEAALPAAESTTPRAGGPPATGRRAAEGGTGRVRRYVAENAARRRAETIVARKPGPSTTGSLAGLANGPAWVA